MATYPFTIRAVDSAGAYTDRNFSITVNNTSIDRFVIGTSTGIWRSPTGLASTWNNEAIGQVTGVDYGNGYWLAWNNNNVTTWGQVRYSPDAINWSSVTPSLSSTPSGYTNSQQCTRIKYRKGEWHAFVSLWNGSNWRLAEYVSSDMLTWTYTRDVLVPFSQATNLTDIGVDDVEYDATSDTWVAIAKTQSANPANGAIYSRTGSGNWTSRQSLTGYPRSGSVLFLNGMWLAIAGSVGATQTVYTSVDATNWTARSVTGTANQGIVGGVYSNGRVIPHYEYAVASGYHIQSSLNGGRTWSQRTSSTQLSNLAGIGANANMRQGIATYGGVTVVIAPTQSANAFATLDDGVTWTTNVGSFSGPLCIATRP